MCFFLCTHFMCFCRISLEWPDKLIKFDLKHLTQHTMCAVHECIRRGLRSAMQRFDDKPNISTRQNLGPDLTTSTACATTDNNHMDDLELCKISVIVYYAITLNETGSCCSLSDTLKILICSFLHSMQYLR